MGNAALFRNTTGDKNIALGNSALFNNTDGMDNTAVGFQALAANTACTHNTGIGFQALLSNTGCENTAIGAAALESGTEANFNTAVGFDALRSNTTGNHNTALGWLAGSLATTGSHNVYIGEVSGLAGESDSCYIESIAFQPSEGVPVLINSASKLGTPASSTRFKQHIRPLGEISEALFSLKPVAFRYKKEIDPAGTSQFGLVAEEVEKVNPDLVVRDKEGKPYSVRYDQVNAMLLNEFLKAHKKVREQGGMITELKKEITALTATVKEQAAQIQKVKATLELSKPGQQTVLNNQSIELSSYIKTAENSKPRKICNH